MEIPRHWRETPTKVQFSGSFKEIGSGIQIFKYPGGEIPLVGSLETIKRRFKARGFKEEVTKEILFRFWSGIPAEAPVSLREAADSFFELEGSEVGK